MARGAGEGEGRDRRGAQGDTEIPLAALRVARQGRDYRRGQLRDLLSSTHIGRVTDDLSTHPDDPLPMDGPPSRWRPPVLVRLIAVWQGVAGVALAVFVLVGIALMAYPYFVANIWLLWGIGVAMTVYGHRLSKS